jgi:aminoglycoside/choline kinase family phosphotransferase
MNEMNTILAGYKEKFGNYEEITALPGSGSERKYFRIISGDKSCIGAFNPNPEENEAFIGFTKHFISIGLPVPEIFRFLPDKNIYFLQDLGDVNLYKWFHTRIGLKGFDEEANVLFRKIIDNLILFQTEGIKGLNLELCYPHKIFDRQSMMWDMNYFKYMFLKLVSVPFNEQRLENDYIKLSDYLLASGQDYFLYRDFQSANIMVINNNPWFIDYQGGRKGSPQYDLASLLYDAKIPLTQAVREEFLEYYIRRFCEVSGSEMEIVREYYTGFVMVRIMQALGAFGFRGLYENKPGFAESIVPAVRLLQGVIESAEKKIRLTELYNTIKLISETRVFKRLLETQKK